MLSDATQHSNSSSSYRQDILPLVELPRIPVHQQQDQGTHRGWVGRLDGLVAAASSLGPDMSPLLTVFRCAIIDLPPRLGHEQPTPSVKAIEAALAAP